MAFDFTLNVDQPFTLIPTHGILQPRESTVVKITFIPPSAAPFSATAVLQAGGTSHPIFVSGICDNGGCSGAVIVAAAITVFVNQHHRRWKVSIRCCRFISRFWKRACGPYK